MVDSLMPLPGTIIRNKYKIIKEIGRGGMGVVYLVEHLELNINKAIKILYSHLASDKNIRDRFIAEAKNHAKLNHPNIVKVNDAEFIDQLSYFVMDYIEGEDLNKKLKKYTLNLKEVNRIFRQIVDALSYVHAEKLVHRDIKPSNIIIESKTGKAIITDFGISKSLSAQKTSDGFTKPGQIVGTPEYMPPEQIEGKKSDITNDIYSLGLVVYEMLTKKRCFDFRNKTIYQIIGEVKEKYPAKPSAIRKGLNSAIDSVILKAIHKESKERYQRITEFYNAFLKAQKLPEPVTPRPPAFDFQKYKHAILGGSGVLIVLIIIMLFAVRPTNPTGVLIIQAEPVQLSLSIDNNPRELVSLPLQRELASGSHSFNLIGEPLESPISFILTVPKGDTITKLLQLPTAPKIINIDPTPGRLGELINFTSADISDKEIKAWEWYSDLDGLIATSQNFSSKTLSTGTHKITLRILDNNFKWSKFSSPSILIIEKKIDTTPPAIYHSQIMQCYQYESLEITANVKDDAGIMSVFLYYKTNLNTAFKNIQMQRSANGDYSAILSGSDIKGIEFKYYFEAFDNNGNQIIHKNPANNLPYSVRVTPRYSVQQKYTIDLISNVPAYFYLDGEKLSPQFLKMLAVDVNAGKHIFRAINENGDLKEKNLIIDGRRSQKKISFEF